MKRFPYYTICRIKLSSSRHFWRTCTSGCQQHLTAHQINAPVMTARREVGGGIPFDKIRVLREKNRERGVPVSHTSGSRCQSGECITPALTFTAALGSPGRGVCVCGGGNNRLDGLCLLYLDRARSAHEFSVDRCEPAKLASFRLQCGFRNSAGSRLL